MKKRKFRNTIALLVFLFITTVFIGLSARADDGKEYEQSLKQPSLYSSVVTYLRGEQKAGKTQIPTFNDSVILLGADLVFSLLCLWLTVFLIIGKKFASIKNFAWFIFSINISWFVFLLLYRMCWDVLDFLVIRLRPDLGPSITDSFSIIIIIVSVLIYIWLLARTFHLNFPGALGTFFVSNLSYLLVIFLVFTFVNLEQDRLFILFKENLGIRAIVRSYLSDVKKITSSRDILSFIRIRPYHL